MPKKKIETLLESEDKSFSNEESMFRRGLNRKKALRISQFITKLFKIELFDFIVSLRLLHI